MSEPTPPGVPQDPAASTPPSAPPSAPSPPPSAPPPPPGGGYAAGPPVSGNVAPLGYANNDEKTWALVAHFGGILVGFIAPLVAMLVKGNESPTVRAHAVAALNFQLTWLGPMILAIILMTCTLGLLFILPLAVAAVIIIFSVIAGMKANEGVLYQYPMTYRFVK